MDDFGLNQLLRSHLRVGIIFDHMVGHIITWQEEKWQKAEEAAEQKKLHDKAGINIPILKESPVDITAAKNIKFNKGGSHQYGFIK